MSITVRAAADQFGNYPSINDGVIDAVPPIYEIEGHEWICRIGLAVDMGLGYRSKTGSMPTGVPQITFDIKFPPLDYETARVHREAVAKKLQQATPPIPISPTGSVRLLNVNDFERALEALEFDTTSKNTLLEASRDIIRRYEAVLQRLDPADRAGWPTGPSYELPPSTSLQGPAPRPLLPEGRSTTGLDQS